MQSWTIVSAAGVLLAGWAATAGNPLIGLSGAVFLALAALLSRRRWLMLPALFGVSVGQINLLLDTVLASFLETGSLSWLYYSDRLLELPLALFGITIATVILPSLSREHANDSPTEFAG